MDQSVYQRYLREDMRRLEESLARIAKADEALQRKIAGGSGGPLQLLNLACGACDEADTLTDLFGSVGSGEKRDMKFVGLDLRAREIAEAAARFGNAEKVDFDFIQGDATQLDRYKQLPEDFDVVFVRHQNLWNGRRAWEEIYHKALEKLSPQGRLIITSYFDREHTEALGVIQEQGGELIASQVNPISRELSTPGKSVDRHVAVLKRQS